MVSLTRSCIETTLCPASALIPSTSYGRISHRNARSSARDRFGTLHCGSASCASFNLISGRPCSFVNSRRGNYSAAIRASSELSNQETYDGVYGPWKVEQEDVTEVLAYRAGLVSASACFLIASSSAFLPSSPFLHSLLDPLYFFGASSLGLSLFLIHIYVTPIKRTLQGLWLTGLLGSIALELAVQQQGQEEQLAGLVQFVLNHPEGVWAVGPLFASLTGLVFKEGLCYGKIEATALVFVIPSLLLGHLSGLMGEGLEKGLLATWMALFTLFAARKFTQPIKDDIGDKSVFIFQALPEDKQQELLRRLQTGFPSDRSE